MIKFSLNFKLWITLWILIQITRFFILWICNWVIFLNILNCLISKLNLSSDLIEFQRYHKNFPNSSVDSTLIYHYTLQFMNESLNWYVWTLFWHDIVCIQRPLTFILSLITSINCILSSIINELNNQVWTTRMRLYIEGHELWDML